MVLHFDPVAIELENSNQWIEAADYLYEQWRREPKSKNGILCAGAEIWYLICYWDHPFINRKIDLGLYMRRLKEITEAGDQYFPHDPDYLALFGYLMHVQPFWFVLERGDDVDEIQNRGLEMVKEASVLAPDDPDISAIHMNVQDHYERRSKQLCQWGGGAVNDYFKAVLNAKE